MTSGQITVGKISILMLHCGKDRTNENFKSKVSNWSAAVKASYSRTARIPWSKVVDKRLDL